MKPDHTAVREYVREACKILGISVRDLARRTQVAPSTMARFMEFDVHHPLPDRALRKIGEISGLKMSTFVARTGDFSGHRLQGLRLRAIREAAAETRTVFAERLGLSDRLLTELEEGTIPMSLPLLDSLHERAGISTDWVLFGSYKAVPARIVQRFVELRTAADPS